MRAEHEIRTHRDELVDFLASGLAQAVEKDDPTNPFLLALKVAGHAMNWVLKESAGTYDGFPQAIAGLLKGWQAIEDAPLRKKK